MKSNMNLSQNSTRKPIKWVTLCAAVILIAAIVFGTAQAAYIAYTYQKRTVSTWKDTATWFNSNYMEAVDIEAGAGAYPTIVVTKGGDISSISLIVCNYNRLNPDIYSTDDIEYTFKMTICDENKNVLATSNYNGFSVKKDSTTYNVTTNPLSVSNQVLTGGEQSVITYTVYFPGDFENYIKLEAIPTSESASKTDNHKLGCYISTSVLNRNIANSWSGALTGLEGKTGTDKVDGFNYEISGSGEATYVLSWDTSYVELNQWFFVDHTGLEVEQETDSTIKSITLSLPLGEEDNLFHTYQLQFYRTAPQSSSETKAMWDSWITFEEVTD